MELKKLKSGSDIRGVACGENKTLTVEVAKKLSMAFAMLVAKKSGKSACEVSIALGRDSRISGPTLLQACAEGISETGANVLDFGMCTTPAMYVSILTEGFTHDASIMLTASHHPWQMNGLKFFTRDGGISFDMLSEIVSLAESLEENNQNAKGEIKQVAFLNNYKAQLATLIKRTLDKENPKPLTGLHVVVDAGNGAGGFYSELLAELGAETSGSQFLEPDGNFPNHPPNPENKEAMHAIAQAVCNNKADLGIIFDADCDRSAVVDHTGKEMNRNRLIALISAILLEETKGATIVTDSVTSSGLARFIAEKGGVHYRYKRGYRNVIDEAVRLNSEGIYCPLAIETSGHAALKQNHFLDDGMYLATLLLIKTMQLKKENKELASLLEGLAEPKESVELRLQVQAPNFAEVAKEAIQKVTEYAKQQNDWHIAPDNREGIRIAFDVNGQKESAWFLLRLSVHDPVMPLNAESDVEGGVKVALSNLQKVLTKIEGIDLNPFDTI